METTLAVIIVGAEFRTRDHATTSGRAKKLVSKLCW
jgi:hypothetical protein